MRALCAILLLAGAILTAQAQFDYDGLPEGEGRLETFQHCIGCHSTAIIRQQRLTRDQWDDVLDWMVETQGMQPMVHAMRSQVLNYLSEQFNPDVPR
jgi:hypothetical protein